MRKIFIYSFEYQQYIFENLSNILFLIKNASMKIKFKASTFVKKYQKCLHHLLKIWFLKKDQEKKC